MNIKKFHRIFFLRFELIKGLKQKESILSKSINESIFTKYFDVLKQLYIRRKYHQDYFGHFWNKQRIYKRFFSKLKTIKNKKKLIKIQSLVNTISKIQLNCGFFYFKKNINICRNVNIFKKNSKEKLRLNCFIKWNQIVKKQKRNEINYSILTKTGLQVFNLKKNYLGKIRNELQIRRKNLEIKQLFVRKKEYFLKRRFFSEIYLIMNIQKKYKHKLKKKVLKSLKQNYTKKKIKKYGKYIILNRRFSGLLSLTFNALKMQVKTKKKIIVLKNLYMTNLLNKYFDLIFFAQNNKTKERILFQQKIYNQKQKHLNLLIRQYILNQNIKKFKIYKEQKNKKVVFTILNVNTLITRQKMNTIIYKQNERIKKKFLNKLQKKRIISLSLLIIEEILMRNFQKIFYNKLNFYLKNLLRKSSLLVFKIKKQRVINFFNIFITRSKNSILLKNRLENHLQMKQKKQFQCFFDNLKNLKKVRNYLNTNELNNKKELWKNKHAMTPFFETVYYDKTKDNINKKFYSSCPSNKENSSQIKSKDFEKHLEDYLENSLYRTRKQSTLYFEKIDECIERYSLGNQSILNEYNQIVSEHIKDELNLLHCEEPHFFSRTEPNSDGFRSAKVLDPFSSLKMNDFKNFNKFERNTQYLSKEQIILKIEDLIFTLENEKNNLSSQKKRKIKKEIKEMYYLVKERE